MVIRVTSVNTVNIPGVTEVITGVRKCGNRCYGCYKCEYFDVT